MGGMAASVSGSDAVLLTGGAAFLLVSHFGHGKMPATSERVSRSHEDFVKRTFGLERFGAEAKKVG